MSTGDASIMHAVIVETEMRFSLSELSRICGTDVATLEALVYEGVLIPLDDQSTQWIFDGTALPRARKVTRLLRDMKLDVASAALVLDLLDEIDSLNSQLRRLRI